MKLLALISLVVLTIHTGENFVLRFQRIISRGDHGQAVKTTSDGGFVVVGYVQTHSKENCATIVKYAPEGHLEWYKNYNSTYEWDKFLDVVVLNSSGGGFIAVGQIGIGGTDINALIVKLDSNGELVWGIQVPLSGSLFHKVIVESDGYTAVGRYSSTNVNGMLMKFALNGSKIPLFKTYWSADSTDYSMASVIKVSDGYIISGKSPNGYVLKISNGAKTLTWKKTFGSTVNSLSELVIATDSAGYILAGSIINPSGRRWPHDDLLIMKLSEDGNTILWHIQYSDDDGNECINSISSGNDGYYYFTGTLLGKVDTSGKLVWSKYHSGNDIEMTSTGVITVGGNGNDVIIIKTNFDGTDCGTSTTPSMTNSTTSLSPTDYSALSYYYNLIVSPDYYNGTANNVPLEYLYKNTTECLNGTCRESNWDCNCYCDKQGGVCVNDRCICNDFFFGEKCSIRNCEGEMSNITLLCSDHGNCINPPNCTCQEGYFGSKCESWKCNGIIHNKTNVCNSQGNCTNSDTCVCESGFCGKFCFNFSCSGTCSTEETFVCSGKGKCIKPNICFCEENFYPNGTFGNCEYWNCSNIRYDSLEVCNSRNGSCDSPDNCTCNSNYYGETCDNYCNCNSHGDCKGIPKKCSCNDYYYGSGCEVLYCGGEFSNETTSLCSGHGSCNSPPNCTCETNYYGEKCDNYCNCNSHGNCKGIPKKCSCNDYYYGSGCEVLYCGREFSNETVSLCSGHGSCNSPPICSCTIRWDGHSCSYFFPEEKDEKGNSLDAGVLGGVIGGTVGAVLVIVIVILILVLICCFAIVFCLIFFGLIVVIAFLGLLLHSKERIEDVIVSADVHISSSDEEDSNSSSSSSSDNSYEQEYNDNIKGEGSSDIESSSSDNNYEQEYNDNVKEEGSSDIESSSSSSSNKSYEQDNDNIKGNPDEMENTSYMQPRVGFIKEEDGEFDPSLDAKESSEESSEDDLPNNAVGQKKETGY